MRIERGSPKKPAARDPQAVVKDRIVGSLGSRVLTNAGWSAVSRRLGLSGRELEIVRGVFDDKLEFAIAADLHISPRTVHTHVERLHHKLAITNRAQLAVRVMQEFLALTASAKKGVLPRCASLGGGRRARRLPARAAPRHP